MSSSMEDVRRTLEEDGVAVVTGVMTSEECDDHVAELKSWLTQFGPDGFPENRASLIHKYNIAHHPTAWSVRLKTIPVFEQIYGTSKLASSFDGVSIGPPEKQQTGQKTTDTASLPKQGSKNLHLDQGGHRVGLHAVQGAVYLEQADHDDWVLAVINKSHIQHEAFFSAHEELRFREQEFMPLTEDHIKWYQSRGCEVRRISVPKGGMVLWDSRTVHAGAPPLPSRADPNRWRFVVFVCMVPAAWATPEEANLKRKAFHGLRTSRHWPAQGFATFAYTEKPQGHLAVTELPEIAQTAEVRLLASDLDYDFDDGKPNGPPKPKVLVQEVSN